MPPADGTPHSHAKPFQAAPPQVDAIAEHCFGGAYCNEPFTRLTVGKPYRQGGEFIANLKGHREDGSVELFGDHGCAYRLRVVAKAVA